MAPIHMLLLCMPEKFWKDPTGANRLPHKKSANRHWKDLDVSSERPIQNAKPSGLEPNKKRFVPLETTLKTLWPIPSGHNVLGKTPE